MILLDALIVIGVLIGFILGFKDGFVRKLIGIIGFVIAVVAAVFFSHNLGLFIESAFRIEYYLAEIIGGVFENDEMIRKIDKRAFETLH